MSRPSVRESLKTAWCPLCTGPLDRLPIRSTLPKERRRVIDLHMHTTASDGTSSPESLVERAWQAGIRTMSVTDHDTMASVGPATAAAVTYGMTVVPGIEITAVHGGKDVHVLGYFLSENAPGLQDMLATQRRN